MSGDAYHSPAAGCPTRTSHPGRSKPRLPAASTRTRDAFSTRSLAHSGASRIGTEAVYHEQRCRQGAPADVRARHPPIAIEVHQTVREPEIGGRRRVREPVKVRDQKRRFPIRPQRDQDWAFRLIGDPHVERPPIVAWLRVRRIGRQPHSESSVAGTSGNWKLQSNRAEALPLWHRGPSPDAHTILLIDDLDAHAVPIDAAADDLSVDLCGVAILYPEGTANTRDAQPGDGSPKSVHREREAAPLRLLSRLPWIRDHPVREHDHTPRTGRRGGTQRRRKPRLCIYRLRRQRVCPAMARHTAAEQPNFRKAPHRIRGQAPSVRASRSERPRHAVRGVEKCDLVPLGGPPPGRERRVHQDQPGGQQGRRAQDRRPAPSRDVL
jgi:hypothetical protein